MSHFVRAASSSAPLTPISQKSVPSTPSAQADHQATPTGSWKHPRFDEITRRQYATTFDERNVRILLANSVLLLLAFFGRGAASQIPVLGTFIVKPLDALLQALPFSWWIKLAVYLVFANNIVNQLKPLWRRRFPDDITDIPLTPSQRQIMGLKPDAPTPQTPGSAFASPNYVTPPRYQKSTPRSSFSNQAERGSSPLTGSPRAGMANSTSNSPFSPSTGSPLFQKALGGGSAQKRLSYGGTPLTSSIFGDSSSSATPSTPTPGTGKASVGLNNKWLYEKRRDSPRSNLFN